MKSVKTVLSHIFPKNSKFGEHSCFNKLISLLPKRFKDHTLFCYKKNETLFFVFDHPGIKMEFNYNLNLINELLNIMKKNSNECKNLEIKSIKSFVKNDKTKRYLYKKREFNSYKENSKGDFENFAKNQEIKEILEKIREKIKSLRDED